MKIRLRSLIDKLARLLRIKPLSLADKCRMQFGAAILVVLLIALFIPYYWMGKLIDKIVLDSGRAVVHTVYERHFQVDSKPIDTLPMLQENGVYKSDEERSVKWVRLNAAREAPGQELSSLNKEIIDRLREEKGTVDFAWIDRSKPVEVNNYIRLVRAKESCLTCHYPEGSTNEAFKKNQAVGAIIVQMPAREISKILFINRLMVIVAYLLAATGAVIAFYTIAQRIILRPIRQLRALVSNVAEGNLDARSSIRSNDEYEKLSDAFNNMLDGLQESQQKLRHANKELDGKIGQLSERNIELFKANQLKSEFLANMSHEFKTPLNSILGFAQLLKEKPADNPEKSKRYAGNIITSGQSLLNMINDLLDLAKAEAGKMEIKITKTSISDLCHGLAAFVSPMTRERMIKVRMTIADNIPIVQTDAGKVQQILYNILSNAIKFTPENGRIVINARMLTDVTVRISVTDTGPGISEENQSRIFDKFRQLDGSITRNASGTGLGLAISKELADLLAADLSVESKFGEGATFHLDIPVNLPGSDLQQEPKELISEKKPSLEQEKI